MNAAKKLVFQMAADFVARVRRSSRGEKAFRIKIAVALWLHRRDCSVAELAKRLGVSRQRVHRIVRELHGGKR